MSSNVETPMNALLFATGDNLTFSGDVIRRTLMCTMDAGCERPELRDFKTDAASEAKERRGELVGAAREPTVCLDALLDRQRFC